MANINIKRQILNVVLDYDERFSIHLPKSKIRELFANRSDDVDLHLEQLKREGLLEFGKGDHDLISLPRMFPQVKRIELSGRSVQQRAQAAGLLPSGYIALDLCGAGIALKGNHFARVIDDDSMSDAGIKAGDIAIFRIFPPVRGEIVAAEVSGQEIIRRYVIVSGIPHFLAENPVRPDLITAYDRTITGTLAYLICADPNGLGRILSPTPKVNYHRDGGLETESIFVSMLTTETEELRQIKRSRPASASASKTRGRIEKKATAIQSPKKRSAHPWPKLPSGIALNDKQAAKYKPGSQRLVCDEQPDRPFGWAAVQAVTQYAAQTKQNGDADEMMPSNPKTAKSPPRSRKTLRENTRRRSSN